MDTAPLVVVLGASGYVGGRLVPLLLDAGYRVRCLARSPEKLRGLPWSERVEVVRGDLLEADTLPPAFERADVCYYLVHSLGEGDGEDFAERDRRAAASAARVAERAGVRRIVYLGGLGEVDERTSPHLRSRAEVALILAASDVAVTILRAAVIIGSGSASFEMLRHLVERLPVMVTPRWVGTRVQPIAIRDVLRYLLGVIRDLDDRADHDYDIGGPDVLTYLDMMRAYARMAGLRPRLVVTVPLLTPGLSSHWVNLVTPVPFGVARPLISSLANEVVVRHGPAYEDIARVVGGPALTYEESLRLALRRLRDADVVTSWRDAEVAGRTPAEPYPGDPDWSGGTLLRHGTRLTVKAPPEAVFRAVCRIGGDRGWPTFRWAWSLRGWVDKVIGGVGLRRGRRDPERLRVGDALDFWRVEDVRQPSAGEPGVLRLRAEMRLPGSAWLDWTVLPSEDRARPGTVLVQRALFAPRGLLGRAYWWLMWPFHGPIFASMARALARDAWRTVTSSGAPTAPPAAPASPGSAPGGRRRHARRAG
jgi:uncharacterized protein YbjT (DUF2867 family)